MYNTFRWKPRGKMKKILTCVFDAGKYSSGWIYMWNIGDVAVR